MAKKKTNKRKNKPISFEASMEELKQIVMELEAGNLTLEESLQKYEMGIARLKNCHAALQLAEQRIEQLIDLDESGNAVVVPFDNSASANQQGNVRRPASSLSDHEQIDMSGDHEDDSEYADIDSSLDDELGSDSLF